MPHSNSYTQPQWTWRAKGETRKLRTSKTKFEAFPLVSRVEEEDLQRKKKLLFLWNFPCLFSHTRTADTDYRLPAATHQRETERRVLCLSRETRRRRETERTSNRTRNLNKLCEGEEGKSSGWLQLDFIIDLWTCLGVDNRQKSRRKMTLDRRRSWTKQLQESTLPEWKSWRSSIRIILNSMQFIFQLGKPKKRLSIKLEEVTAAFFLWLGQVDKVNRISIFLSAQYPTSFCDVSDSDPSLFSFSGKVFKQTEDSFTLIRFHRVSMRETFTQPSKLLC